MQEELENQGNPIDPTPQPEVEPTVETTPTHNPYRKTLDLSPVLDKMDQLKAECSKVLVGQDELIDLLMTCILSEGHILLEGVPGIAKTLTSKVLAQTIDSGFSRIQFTPDLMPSDIIGTSIYNMKQSEFQFNKGPIFSNLILIDEINRAPAKTQAALFEVMEENQVTFDGTTYPMTYPFIVIATQNPIEQEGTYRLPEGQLDRFLMKINLEYPSQRDEINILKKFKNNTHKTDLATVNPIVTAADLEMMKEKLGQIHIEDQIIEYISEIIQITRNHGQIYLGASPRAGLAMLRAGKVTAMLQNRDFVIPDDIQNVAPYILNHRMILAPTAEMEGYSTQDVITEILKTVEVPR